MCEGKESQGTDRQELFYTVTELRTRRASEISGSTIFQMPDILVKHSVDFKAWLLSHHQPSSLPC